MSADEIKQMLNQKYEMLIMFSAQLELLEKAGMTGFSNSISTDIKNAAVEAGCPIDTVSLYTTERDRLIQEINQTNSDIDKLKSNLK
ncbi:hypothetical protein [Acinetobacter guillouiae]|uniref:hypothetical protein n=1 Tax=Acinetobacter guillouiae TaxID=106649 RepID=UPI001CD508D8|nr:hypothetical protein [Acinetobacter guillouiae]